MAPQELQAIYDDGQQNALPKIDPSVMPKAVRVKDGGADDGLCQVIGKGHPPGF